MKETIPVFPEGGPEAEFTKDQERVVRHSNEERLLSQQTPQKEQLLTAVSNVDAYNTTPDDRFVVEFMILKETGKSFVQKIAGTSKELRGLFLNLQDVEVGSWQILREKSAA